MRQILYIISLMILGQPLLGQTKMSATEVQQFKTNIASSAAKTKSISTDFEESKQLKVLKQPTISSGIMRYKGDMLLWQYQTPKKTALLFSGNKLTLKNDKGRKTSIDLNRNKRFKQLQQLMMGSYNGKLFTDPSFAIEYYKQGKQDIAVLTPKSGESNKQIREVSLTFNRPDYTVSTIKIVESNGDVSTITLKNIRLNAPIADTEFNI